MLGALSHIKSVTIGDFTGTVTVFNSQGSTTTANASNIVRPSDWNSGHQFNATITGNTDPAGVSTVAGATAIYLAGGSNVTLGMSTGASAATVFVNGGAVQSVWRANQDQGNVFATLGANSLYLRPMYPAANVIGSILNVPLSFGGTTTSASRVYAATLSGCLYAQDVGGNSTQMTSISSFTASFKASRTSTAASYTLAVAGTSFSTTGSSNLSAPFLMQVPFSATLAAGATYFLGVANSTASTNQNSAMTVGIFGITNIGTQYGLVNSNTFGLTNASNIMAYDGMVYSSTSNAWPATIPYNSLLRATSGFAQYVEFVNQTI